MAPTADARANRPGEIAGSAAAEPSEAGVPAAVARPSSWARLAENPLLALLATAVVALLIFNLTSTNDRITRLENSMEARFAAQDAKIEALDARLTAQIAALDAKIEALDARLTAQIEALDAKIGEMNLKLTALVAALNMTDQVDAATAGTAALDAPTRGPDST